VYTPQVIEIRRTAWQPVYARLEWLLSLVTDRIIAVNDGDRRRMEGWRIPSHKIVTIPNGVPIDCQPDVSLAESMRASLGIRRDQALVMQVGRLSPQKDPLAFVEGARRVVASRPGVHFALVGEGPLHGAVVSRIRELGLTGQVHLMGCQDSARDLMVGAQVVTLTSRWEGTPYALLEAMARSRTVVATAVNGCREVVEDGQNGFLVAAGDPDAWADRVVWLLDHPDSAAEMGRTGRRIVEARYSVDRMVHRTLDLYQRVLNGL